MPFQHRPHEIDFKKPTIFCLGGAEAVENQYISPAGSDHDETRPNFKEILGMAKIAETALGGKGVRSNPDTPPILSFASSSTIGNKTHLLLSNRWLKRWGSPDARLLAETFLPLISSDFKIKQDGTIAGKHLPLEDTIERLSKLTLFGQSYGGSLARQICVAQERHMEQLGYNFKEIATLFDSIVFIGVGPVTNAIIDQSPLNSVYFAHAGDQVSRQRIRDFDTLIPQETGETLLIKGLHHNTTVVWLAKPENPFTFVNCNGEKETIDDNSMHNIRYYTAFSLSDPVRSAIFESALNNAVHRTGPITMEQLLSFNAERYAPPAEYQDPSPTFPKVPTRETTRSYSEMVISKAMERATREWEEETGLFQSRLQRSANTGKQHPL